MTQDLPNNPFKDFDHRVENHRVGAEAVWRDMRAAQGLAHSDRYGGFHVVTRYADVAQVASKHEVYSSAQGISFPPLDLDIRLIPAEVDPPMHRHYRDLLMQFLTPDRVRRLESTVRDLVNQLLDGFAGQKHVDFVAVFARPLPVHLSLVLLGLPLTDARMLDDLVVTLHAHRGDEQGITAALALNAYLEKALVDHKQVAKEPGESIMSSVVLGQVDGRALSLEEQISIIRLLMFGGFDTTTIVLATALWWLATHPEDAQRLREKPELMNTAVEEFVRFTSPATYLRRTVTQDAELGGEALHKGDRVLMSFAAANHDPARFPNPDEIDLARSPNPHLGFGAGIHRCIGSAVARMELRIAISEILKRYSRIELDPNGQIGWESSENQGICVLPVILEA